MLHSWQKVRVTDSEEESSLTLYLAGWSVWVPQSSHLIRLL